MTEYFNPPSGGMRDSLKSLPTEAKKHKYGVALKEERTVDGIVFHSKKEARRYSELKLLEQSGLVTDLRRQVRYDLCVNLTYCGFYKADFVYQLNGKQVVEDAKGAKTEMYRLKKKLMLAVHGIEIFET